MNKLRSVSPGPLALGFQREGGRWKASTPQIHRSLLFNSSLSACSSAHKKRSERFVALSARLLPYPTTSRCAGAATTRIANASYAFCRQRGLGLGSPVWTSKILVARAVFSWNHLFLIAFKHRLIISGG